MDAFKSRQQTLEKKDGWAALAEEAREEKKDGRTQDINCVIVLLSSLDFQKSPVWTFELYF